jgi:drug/metabolite transporter (DMT)-like permease
MQTETARRERLAGIASMVFAVAAFAVMDAIIKSLAPHYPPIQIAAFRGLTSLPLVLIWAALDGGFKQLLPNRWRLHLVRGILAVVMLVTFAEGLRELPLTEAYALVFVAPFMIMALAVPVLGEHVGMRQWCAIAVGLCGTLIVLRPTGAGVISIAGLMMLASAACYAVSVIIVRVLGRTDNTLCLMFSLTALLGGFSLVLAWPVWTPVRDGDWPLLAGLGVSGTLAQFAITDAFRRAPASVVTPFEYTAIVWGVLLDYFVWHALPDALVFAGTAVIVVAGLYVIHQETMGGRLSHDPAGLP